MFGNISLLAWLCVVWVFLTKARGNVYFTNITRVGDNDIFTNEFCKSCSHFGAKNYSSKSCQCESPKLDSVFVRSRNGCVSGQELRKAAGCFYWNDPYSDNVKLIDVEKVNSTYTFFRNTYYTSCQLTPFIAFLDAEEKWRQPFNLSSDVLTVMNDPLSHFHSIIKVTRQSPNLTSLSGLVIKLDLNCTMESNAGSYVKCLMFKIKGVLKFPLCNYTVPTTTPPPPSTATTTSTTTNGNTTPSTTPSPPSTTTTPSTATPDGIIAAILIIGAVLFLALIGAFVFLFKHNYIFNSRSRRGVAREFNNFAVINNPGQQTYTVREEPDYMELPDVYPSNEQITGNSAETSECKLSTELLVVSNAYVREASFPRDRPLPSRPGTIPVNQNNGCEVNDQSDASMVFRNPVVQEALSTSPPRTRSDDFDRLPPAREEKETKSDDHHQHHQHQHHHYTADGAEGEEDLDYQGLETGKRAKSIFICPSCNENSNYQRLSRLGHCPHEQNIEGKEKRPSFYESLTLESGTRESFYESPAHDGEEEERDVNQTPDYQVLEPEETGAGEVLDTSVDHDYNILEEAEPVNGELDEDNNNIGDPCSTDENSGEPLEPSGILHTEDNPAYAVPCKKTIADKSEPVRSELDEDNNKTSDPGPTDENLEETFEPPELDQIDNNPLYAMPLTKNATEEPRRKRSYSM